MKRIVFVAVFLALSVVSSYSYGQDLKPTRCSNGKYGFKDRKTGELVIPCKYVYVWWNFSSECAAVKLNGKWGYIDKTGKEVIPLKFDRVSEFDGRVARVKLNGKWGYSDITGTFYPNIKVWETARFLALQQRERAEIEAREREAEAEASFINFTKSYVEPKIKQWQQKGEFERTADWEQRVNETAIKAKEAELFKEAEKIFIADRSQNFDEGMMTLGAYDADNETYLIRNSIYGNWWVPVPVSEAPIFRDTWNSFIKAPQFVISNDKLSIAGMTFIASNGKSYKSNFAPMNIIYADPAAPAAPTAPAVPHSNQTNTARTTENVANTQESINVISTASSAQTTEKANKSKGRVGLQAGVNFSDLMNIANNSYGIDVKTKLGIQAGLTGEIPLGNTKFAIKTGLLYTQLGTNLEYKQSVSGLNVAETVKITLHSLHFPAHIQYKFGDSSTTLLLHGGFYLDYYMRLDAEYEKTINGYKVDGDSASLFNKENFTNDIGIGVGTALLIQNKCQIGVGYDVGEKTRNLMITLALMFGK